MTIDKEELKEALKEIKKEEEGKEGQTLSESLGIGKERSIKLGIIFAEAADKDSISESFKYLVDKLSGNELYMCLYTLGRLEESKQDLNGYNTMIRALKSHMSELSPEMASRLEKLFDKILSK